MAGHCGGPHAGHATLYNNNLLLPRAQRIIRPIDYIINARTSSVLVNGVLKIFGSFPQNTCAPKKSSNSGESSPLESMQCNGKACDACGEAWPLEGCNELELESEFQLSKAMLRLASFADVKISLVATTTGFSYVDANGDDVIGEGGVLWCLDFRRKAKGGGGGGLGYFDTRAQSDSNEEL